MTERSAVCHSSLGFDEFPPRSYNRYPFSTASFFFLVPTTKTGGGGGCVRIGRRYARPVRRLFYFVPRIPAGARERCSLK